MELKQVALSNANKNYKSDITILEHSNNPNTSKDIFSSSFGQSSSVWEPGKQFW